ncbi:MFS transporter [Marinomonas rhizomae]|uniref:DHA1 family bicyclomycin/chloramphenicol resistance-like MFS transporter n=1 Tax=Marinomonas rhizomae TaxID=491948 RepID=A0A366J2C8_9GAMM|nr:MFS transporter [Marinomonas rhizomae]RBP80479.1 DHA1 family bicyclomycin/chloramphenicol resistance-like MFS transporter [Marinomonas rhizomae]RNF71716.1 MFS transporter [Marinomonas rhizomae]
MPSFPLSYLIFIAMSSPIAINILLPALPNIAKQLNVDISLVQLSYSLYLCALAFGQLLVGGIVNHFGYRKTMLLGLASFTLGSAISGGFGNIEGLLIGRVLQGLGGAIAMSLARALLVDGSGKTKASQKMGYIIMAIAISQSIAPLMGGLINSLLGWQLIFSISVLQGSLLLMLTLKLIPHHSQQTQRPSFRENITQYKTLLQDRDFRTYAVANTLVAICFYVFVSSSPYITNTFKGGIHAYGYWFISISISFMAGGYLSTLINQHLTLDKTIAIGNSISLLGAFLLLLTQLFLDTDYAGLFLPMCLVTFGRGISQPTNQTAAISSINKQSSMAAGLMGFLQLLSGALFAQFIPLIVTSLPTLVFWLIFTCMSFAIWLHLRHWSQNSKQSKNT